MTLAGRMWESAPAPPWDRRWGYRLHNTSWSYLKDISTYATFHLITHLWTLNPVQTYEWESVARKLMTRWQLDNDDVYKLCKHQLVWITHKQQHPSFQVFVVRWWYVHWNESRTVSTFFYVVPTFLIIYSSHLSASVFPIYPQSTMCNAVFQFSED